MRIKAVSDTHTGQSGYSFHCPGCDNRHVVWTTNPHGATWVFNGNLELPTFTPSLHIKTGHYCAGQPTAENCEWCKEDRAENGRASCVICHSFITDGRIQFLTDCTHALAGQTVDLPELPSAQGSST